jgi:hypothetical protein
MYVYVESEKGLYTVGFYDPKGKWMSESDYDSKEKAAERVAWLNGNKTGSKFNDIDCEECTFYGTDCESDPSGSCFVAKP